MLHPVGRPRTRRSVGRPRVQSLVAGTDADRRITHGGGCPKAILPHRNRIESKFYKMIWSSEVHFTKTDAFLIQQLARNMAIQDMYWSYFNKYPEKFMDSPALKVFYTNQKNMIRIATDLGMSTASKVKLGIDIGRLQESVFDEIQDEAIEGDIVEEQS